MFKKLGTQIVLITTICIVVLVAAMIVTTLVSFSGYNDGLLKEKAKIGETSLKSAVDDEQATLGLYEIIFAEDAAFNDAASRRDTDAMTKIYQQNLGSHSELFGGVADSNGSVFFKSEKFPLDSFDFGSVARGQNISGIVKSGDRLCIVSASQNVINGESFAYIVGFLLSNQTYLDDCKKASDCDVTVFSGNTRFATTLGSNMIGTAMASNIESAVINGKQDFSGQATINGKSYYVYYSPMYDYANNVVGAYFAGYDSTEADTEFTTVTVLAIVIGVVGAVGIAVFIFIFCTKRVTTPLKHAESYANEMLAGQLDTTNVTYKFADDEVGRFVETLRSAKHGMNDVVGDSSRILAAMANGDFTETPSVKYPGVFEEIEQNILKIEDDLGQTLSRMNTSSDEVLTGSNQMAEGSQSLADGTTRQASAIEEISATIAEVSTQIANTAQNAAQAGNLSRQTQDRVNEQDQEIQNMVQAMNEISSTSQEIEKIIKTIEDIAFQTNILALNAAVEAARAGDAGKGFAVVADEVRNLASKSAEAASSTTSLITASIEAVGKGSKIAMSTAESMKEVKDMSAQTATLISEIASASAEQNESIRQITTGVEQISQVIQTNSATAEETAASCEELSGQSKLLKDQVARFKINQ
ncbi:MAG: methyl-accepting chemotaxis protein [Ruminiclostridium sp.]|nr:methyl-accepting chemotaxis protein [Ruminiclostridium sp.]